MEEKPKKKVVGRPFPKGVSGNPSGKPKLPEDIRQASRLTVEMFIGLCNKFLMMTPNELQDAIGQGKGTNLEMLVASMIQQGIGEGDPKRFDFLLNRIIGKVPDITEHKGELTFAHLIIESMKPSQEESN
jgi:hypothetical protein